ncbi:MAG TPA: hypothetical protein VMZ50_03300 [Phycisphaerae bacterium]|nr:hypothetical protein [Phycisphaerae bacterium]
MAAGDRVFTARDLKCPTDAVDGIRAAEISVSGASAEDPGDASVVGGPAEVQVGPQRITVSAYGVNPNALRALVGAAAANAVIGYKGPAGANEKHTIKNVVWTTFMGALTIRDPETGGPIPVWGVSGTAEWGASDTLTLMWVSAADS